MRVTVSLSAVLCAFALSACSGGSDGPKETGPTSPPLSAFDDGTCRVLAPDLLALGKAAGRLGDGGKIDAAVLDDLTEAQTAIRPVVEGSEPVYKPALMRLVVAAGLVRLEAKLDAYKPDVAGKELLSAYDEAVQACTSGASPSTGSPAP